MACSSYTVFSGPDLHTQLPKNNQSIVKGCSHGAIAIQMV